MVDFNEALSVLDQLPFMRTYTQILLCFPIVKRSEVIDVLKKATAKLLELVPSLSGQVQNHKDGNVSSGTFRVVPYAHPDGSALRIKLLDDWKSYNDLCDANVPASMLDGTVLAPMKGFPDHYTDADVTPVFIVQANFIPGGLILCFSGMHNLMDGNGLGAVVKMFAILFRGEAVPSELLESANFDRTQLPVSLKPGQSLLPHPEVAPKDKAMQEYSPPSTWSYFSISASNLESLKAENISHVTTNDILTAFVWQAMTRARFPSLPSDPAKGSLLLRAINGRRILDPPISSSYLGNIITCSFNKIPIERLIEAPLSDIAQVIRKETNRINDNHIRSFATLIEKEPDRSKLVFGMDDPEADVLISSWATLPVWEDFGMTLGRPDFVRRPTGGPWRGVCYMMPKRPDRGVDLLISLSEEEMERLREDEMVKAIAEFVG
ncbi:MAG: hypothetical protein LQ352_005127 [Teloschistes flavicans]|nr:MAG: hypothetical protein LQ352_005127 [Teloschistes flavicans]